MKILLIDDDIMTCELIKTILRNFPCEFNIASTLQEGVEKIAKYNPNTILLDLNLPGSTISEVIGKIHEFKRNAAVVLLTGSLRDADRESATEAGADACFDKDILTRAEDFKFQLTKTVYTYKSRKSGSNSITQQIALDKANIPQAEILSLLHDINVRSDKDREVQFGFVRDLSVKFDKITDAFQENKDTITKAFQENKNAIEEFKIEIKPKVEESLNIARLMNGKVSKTIERVDKLESSEKLRIVRENEIKIVADARKYYPKKISTGVKWFFGILIGFFTLTAAIVASWPIFVWLSSHL